MNAAIDVHCKVLDRLLAIPGKKEYADEFKAAAELVRQTTNDVKAKMRDYQEHCKKHGCG